eukprot:SAG25_NODE_999_length_4354_cov_5.464160_4_plen_271_part_00
MRGSKIDYQCAPVLRCAPAGCAAGRGSGAPRCPRPLTPPPGCDHHGPAAAAAAAPHAERLRQGRRQLLRRGRPRPLSRPLSRGGAVPSAGCGGAPTADHGRRPPALGWEAGNGVRLSRRTKIRARHPHAVGGDGGLASPGSAGSAGSPRDADGAFARGEWGSALQLYSALIGAAQASTAGAGAAADTVDGEAEMSRNVGAAQSLLRFLERKHAGDGARAGAEAGGSLDSAERIKRWRWFLNRGAPTPPDMPVTWQARCGDDVCVGPGTFE